MEHKDPATWKAFIEKHGHKNIAQEIGVSNELVRLWVKKGHLPYGANLKKLIEVAFNKLSSSDFELFLDSLSRDILGVGVVRSAAVNE
jgi:hypothetical protein